MHVLEQVRSWKQCTERERSIALEKNSCIRGYHVYKEVCEVAVGESWCAKENPKTILINTLLSVRAMACIGMHYN